MVFERFLRTDEIRKDSSEISLVGSFFNTFSRFKII
jgi:hypothetical protein